MPLSFTWRSGFSPLLASISSNDFMKAGFKRRRKCVDYFIPPWY
jgi:hypothetical protein